MDFLNEEGFEEKMNHYRGRIYYFRPMSYGLEYGFSWAADRETILNFESRLFKKCNLIRINDLDFFEIKDPCEILE